MELQIINLSDPAQFIPLTNLPKCSKSIVSIPTPISFILEKLSASGFDIRRPNSKKFNGSLSQVNSSLQVLPQSKVQESKIRSLPDLIEDVKNKPYFHMFLNALAEEGIEHIKQGPNENKELSVENKELSIENTKQDPIQHKELVNLTENLVLRKCQNQEDALYSKVKIPLKPSLRKKRDTKPKPRCLKTLDLEGKNSNVKSRNINITKIKKTKPRQSRMCHTKTESIKAIKSANKDLLQALVQTAIIEGKSSKIYSSNRKMPLKLKKIINKNKKLVIATEGVNRSELPIKRSNHTPRYKYLTGIEDRPYPCTYCQGRFTTKSYLRQHLRTHTGEKPHKCEVCNRSFREQAALRRHRMTHTGEKPFKCTECDKAYTDKAVLVEHIRVHTGEKPFLCHICSKPFAYTFSFKQHMKRHRGERDHFCDLCDSKFYTASSLATHRKSHTGIRDAICDICGKAFVDKAHLSRHMKIHTGDKSIVCHLCDAGFYRKDALNVHLRKHTGEKPFSCNVCSKKFSDRKAFQVHTDKHTDDVSSSNSVNLELNTSVSHPSTYSATSSHRTDISATSYVPNESQQYMESFHEPPKFQSDYQKTQILLPKVHQHSQVTSQEIVQNFAHQELSVLKLPLPISKNIQTEPENLQKNNCNVRPMSSHTSVSSHSSHSVQSNNSSLTEQNRPIQEPQKYFQDPHKYIQELRKYQEPERYIQELQRFQAQQQQGQHQHQHQHIATAATTSGTFRNAVPGQYTSSLMGAFTQHLMGAAASDPSQANLQNHSLWGNTASPGNFSWGGSSMWRQGNFGGYRP